MLIDSHVNLHHEAYAEDREAVIERARAAGVKRMLTICDKAENFSEILAIADAHEDIFASLGAHPHYAKDHLKFSAEAMIEMARSAPKVIGIGETGLDLHYKYSPLDDQLAVFRAHADAARKLDLPLIIHTRNADAQMADLLEETQAKGAVRILLHCYTSGIELARRAWALGAFISFSGIMTFKNAHDVREVAMAASLDRVILETDCPYLTPVPHRGQRCEPMHVEHVYESFLKLRGIAREEGEGIIADNLSRLFPDLMRGASA